jgi:hypothetical protein
MPWRRCVVLALMVAIGLAACAREEEEDYDEEATEAVATTDMEPEVTDMTTDMATNMSTDMTTDMTTDMAPEQPPGEGGIGASAVADGGGDSGGRRYRHDQAGLEGERLTYYQKPTPEGCESDCAANEACVGWTFIREGFYKPSDPGMCYLMSQVTAWQPSPCCISGVKAGL